MEPVHFLLVDDLEENLLALEALLRRDGLVLLKAHSGTEALELLLQHDVALAMVDVQMPGMDGFELAELMRGMERTKSIPLIFLTAGTADQQRRFRGYEAGAIGFLQKPIDANMLRNKADVFFQLYRQRQEVAQQRDELLAATRENARLLEESRSYAEALQKADKRKDEFLANMSHEIRTPINAIMGLANVLKLQGIPDEQRKIVDTLHASADSLLLLINDLLDISKIDAGSIDLEHIPFDLAEAITLTRDMLESRTQEKGLEFSVDLQAVEDKIFMGDPGRLKQVLLNLCSNAIKFTHEGSVNIETGCDVQGTQAQVTIRVADTGIGIAADKLHAVFDKFVQADSSISRKYGGTGLGLAITKNLIEAMKGSIKLDSVPGEGSTFTISLPLPLSGEVEQPFVVEPVSEECSANKQTLSRILLVEDHQPNVLVATLLLDEFGYEYEVVGNGHEAVSRCKENRYAVVLMDVQMPGMDGFQATNAIRKYEESAGRSSTRIIGMTAHAMAGDKQRCLDAGMDDYITKPFDLHVLQDLLQQHIMAA